MSQHVLPHLLSPAVLHPSAAPLLYLYQACCCLPPLILFIIRSQTLPPLPWREGEWYLCIPPSPLPSPFSSIASLSLPTSQQHPACHLEQNRCLSAVYRERERDVWGLSYGLNDILAKESLLDFWHFKSRSVWRVKTLSCKISTKGKVSVMHAHMKACRGSHTHTCTHTNNKTMAILQEFKISICRH